VRASRAGPDRNADRSLHWSLTPPWVGTAAGKTVAAYSKRGPNDAVIGRFGSSPAVISAPGFSFGAGNQRTLLPERGSSRRSSRMSFRRERWACGASVDPLAAASDWAASAGCTAPTMDAVLFVCWRLKNALRVPAIWAFVGHQTRPVQHRRDTHDLRHPLCLAARTLLEGGERCLCCWSDTNTPLGPLSAGSPILDPPLFHERAAVVGLQSMAQFPYARPKMMTW
jgi:hypothetical protein